MVRDACMFESDYFFEHNYVNSFANEVKLQQEQLKPDLPNSNHNHDDSGDESTMEQPDGRAYLTDSNTTKPTPCT